MLIGMVSGVACLPETVKKTLDEIKNPKKAELLLHVFEKSENVPRAFLEADLLLALCEQECVRYSIRHRGNDEESFASFLPDRQ